MKKSLLILLFVVNTFIVAVACHSESSELVLPQSPTNGNKFYVDSQNGSDDNDGNTVGTAWKSLYNVNRRTYNPGDSIFLKCGSSWESALALKGSGTPEAPVVLTSYGKGNRPHIMGNGKVENVILLENVECWEINNIEISNSAETLGKRTGILIRSLLPGLKRRFHIRNCYIHDVMGNYSMETIGKNTGGIGIIIGIETKLDDILIEDNEIARINRVGIFTNMMNAANTLQVNSEQGKRPITNLVVRRNIIHHCTGDGAIIRNTYKAIISHNIAYENHNGPEELVKAGVALWCRSTDETLFEYNEVYNTRGKMDGQAFDADLDCYRTIVQYNYSHDNEGGFMLVYGSSSDAIVRYNVSVNDGENGKHIFDFPVWTSPRGSGIFHNNTIVIPKGIEPVIADEALQTARFYNNIFYNKGTGKLFVESRNTTALFKNNAYIGYDPSTIKDPSPFFDDPQIESPFKYKTGFESIKKFKLKSKSPYHDKGVNVKEVEGDNYWLPESEKDIEGNIIDKSKIPLGAFSN